MAHGHLDAVADRESLYRLLGRNRHPEGAEAVDVYHLRRERITIGGVEGKRRTSERGEVEGLADNGRLDAAREYGRRGSKYVPRMERGERSTEVEVLRHDRVRLRDPAGAPGRRNQHTVVGTHEHGPTPGDDDQVATTATDSGVDHGEMYRIGQLPDA